MSNNNKNKMNSVINWTKKHLRYNHDDEKKKKNIFSRRNLKFYTSSKSSKNKNKSTNFNDHRELESSNNLTRSATLYESSTASYNTNGVSHRLQSQSFRVSPSKSSGTVSKESSPIKELDYSSHSRSSISSSHQSEVSFSVNSFTIRPNSSMRYSGTNNSGIEAKRNSHSEEQSSMINNIISSNSTKVPEIYPEDLNPFTDEESVVEEEKVEVAKSVVNNSDSANRTSYPLEMNPFGSDSENDEESDEMITSEETKTSNNQNDITNVEKTFTISEPPTPPPEKRKIFGSSRNNNSSNSLHMR